MQIFKWMAIVIGMSFFLASCGSGEDTENYLIWHPAKLFREVDQCQAARNPEQERAAYCKMVLKTISTFMGVVTQQQLEPEAFGLKVLNKEMDFANLQQGILKAQSNLSSLKANKAPQAQIDKATKDLADLEMKYNKTREDIGMMLAAIGMISPE